MLHLIKVDEEKEEKFEYQNFEKFGGDSKRNFPPTLQALGWLF